MDEIAELKAQIAALQGKVARFEVMQNRGRGAVPAEIVDKQAAPGVRLDVGASISFPVVASSFVAPDKKQLVEIRELVGSIYPQLMNSEHCAQWHRHVSHEEHEEAYYKMLAAALVALFSGMRALSKPDVTRYWTEHRDYCVSFCAALGNHRRSLSMNPFLVAVLATKSIPYSGLFMDGCSLSLGLSPHVGRQLDPAMLQAALKTERILAPSRVERAMVAPSPARVVQIGF